MFKLITFIMAALPVVLFLKAIFFGQSKKRGQAVSEFRKQVDRVVWFILFCIGCTVVYGIAKLIFEFSM
jgi:hypothetical protein